MKVGYRALVGNRDFVLIWLGQTISRFGDTFQDLALVWFALQLLGHDYWSVGLILFAECTPYLLFGLLGGVVSDRWDRKKVMIVSDIARGLVVLLLPLLDILGMLALWHLVAIAFLLTSLRVFFQPALQAAVPQLVNEDQVVAANGLLFASYQAASVLGPLAAGFLFAALPVRMLFALNSATFFISALSICFIRLVHRQQAIPLKLAHVRADIADTMRSLRAAPIVLWSILLSALAISLMAGILRLGFPAFTTQVLGSGPEVYGTLMSSLAFGTVAGALLIGRLRTPRHGLLLFVGWVFYGLFLALIGVSTGIPFVILMAALMGAAGAVIDVMVISVIQINIPEQQLGKALSFFSTLANVGDSASSLLIGASLGVFTAASVLISSGAATGAIGLLGLYVLWRAAARPIPHPAHADGPERIEQPAV
jgi:MFS family permease